MGDAKKLAGRNLPASSLQFEMMGNISGRAEMGSEEKSGTALHWAVASYVVLVVGFWLGVRHSELTVQLANKLPWAFASFATLLAPLWFFGFGAADWIGREIRPLWLVPLSVFLSLPYFLFSLPTGEFRWGFGLSMLGLPVALATLLSFRSPGTKLGWQDLSVLAAIAATHILKLLAGAWPYPGLASLSKLYLIDVALYLYLVVRRLEGMGYSLIPSRSSVSIGLQEFCFFLPFGLGLGAALRFIHFHGQLPSALTVAGAVVLTFLLVALPEEIFFRAILQNLLETRLGRRWALVMAAVLFGLGHFNKGATFNWRYVLLAAIAGIFYGRAWRAQRQILASAITHTAVDVIWSLWFR